MLLVVRIVSPVEPAADKVTSPAKVASPDVAMVKYGVAQPPDVLG